MKKIKYFHVWMLLLAFCYAAIYFLIFGFSLSSVQVFHFVMGLVIISVNWFFLSLQTNRDSLDEKISILGFSVYVSLSYSIVTILGLVLLSLLNCSLKTQLIFVLVVHLLLVLAIFISRITTSHVRSVGKREYDYVSLSNEISELLSLLEAKTKSEEISSLKDEFRFISPSSKEEAIEIDRRIKAELKDLLSRGGRGDYSKIRSLIEERKIAGRF